MLLYEDSTSRSSIEDVEIDLDSRPKLQLTIAEQQEPTTVPVTTLLTTAEPEPTTDPETTRETYNLAEKHPLLSSCSCKGLDNAGWINYGIAGGFQVAIRYPEIR